MGDITSGEYGDERYRTRRGLAWQKLRAQVAGWPRQPDHLPIAEGDLRRWAAGRLTTRRRLWVGRYFTLELARMRRGRAKALRYSYLAQKFDVPGV